MKIPVGLSLPYSLFALDRNLIDVRRLLGVVEVPGPSRSRKDAEVVNRSAVVLACACWEAFLEELALDALAFLIGRLIREEPMSTAARQTANRALQHIDAGQSYSILLQLGRHRQHILGPFNTPKAPNADALYQKALGIDQISSNWRWRGVPASAARSRLDRYVSLRGDSAHRVKGMEPVTKRDVLYFVQMLERLAWLTCDAVREWLFKATRASPWEPLPPFSI